MASFDQKLRTLYLMEILLERTDDEHMLNASELCTILNQEYGISTDRRTIYTEMEILDKFGLDIQQKKGKCPAMAGRYVVRIFCRATSGSYDRPCRIAYAVRQFLSDGSCSFGQ